MIVSIFIEWLFKDEHIHTANTTRGGYHISALFSKTVMMSDKKITNEFTLIKITHIKKYRSKVYRLLVKGQSHTTTFE